jgi:hypothetical protein
MNQKMKVPFIKLADNLYLIGWRHRDSSYARVEIWNTSNGSGVTYGQEKTEGFKLAIQKKFITRKRNLTKLGKAWMNLQQ